MPYSPNPSITDAEWMKRGAAYGKAQQVWESVNKRFGTSVTAEACRWRKLAADKLEAAQRDWHEALGYTVK